MHPRSKRQTPGIKRPFLKLPETLEGTQSFCITIPGGFDNKKALLDLLQISTYWFSWELSAGTEGKQTADAWRDLLQLPELKMCCCPEPTNRRYNSAGQLEVSYDGGLTWVVDNSLDDRFSGAISPPLAGADGAEKRCIAATAGQEFVKANLIDSLSEGMTYAELTSAGVALIAVLGVTGVGLLVGAFVAAIFLAGVTAVQAAFTSEVWTDFRCILNCRMSDDGSFTMLQWQQVRSDILSTFTGAVSAILYNWVNSVGTVGLTNAVRSGFAAAGDCDDCDCDCGGETIGLSMVNFYGDNPDQTGCNVQADSKVDGSLYSVTWIWDGTNPFKLTVEGLLFGVTGTSQWQWYDGTGAGPFSGAAAPINATLSFLELSGNAGVFRVSWDVVTP